MSTYSLRLILAGACLGAPAAFSGASPSLPVWAGDAFLLSIDTRHDTGGHAAPFLIDLDEDRRRDLVIGSINGTFHYYKNMGTDTEPRFRQEAIGLTAEGSTAKIRNWCCMAVAPQFIDLDGDGILDLTAASYGGPSYWFKGLGGNQFKLPHQLLAWRGYTLLARENMFSQRNAEGRLDGSLASIAANIAWTKWNADDRWDLLLGNHFGQLFVFSGMGKGDFGPPGLPEFSRLSIQKGHEPVNELLIDGQKVLPEDDYHAAPAVADWDGDGLWDILVASKSGDVYFLRNTGEPGAPEFKTRELILEGGQGFQLLEPDESPKFGIRTQIHVADYNGDGKPDLLVGCFVGSVTPRIDLCATEREELQAIWQELEAIDEQIGNKRRELREKFSPYYRPENKALSDRVKALQEKMRPYLVTHTVKGSRSDYVMDITYHGNVWVFLRK